MVAISWAARVRKEGPANRGLIFYMDLHMKLVFLGKGLERNEVCIVDAQLIGILCSNGAHRRLLS